VRRTPPLRTALAALGAPWLRILPTTALGRRAVWLAVASVVLTLLWSVLAAGAALSFLSGLAGSVAALVAIVRRGDRALTVYAAALLPGVLVVVFVLAELLVGHD
jgi:hypothetical protein